jgi:hypothetical protein
MQFKRPQTAKQEE